MLSDNNVVSIYKIFIAYKICLLMKKPLQSGSAIKSHYLKKADPLRNGY